ncbi:MAG: hypothetical protein HQL31_00875 [Planctomycetes bacterium]|nr:hypothetical protein [Planctomycetota bacterium]
MSSFIRVVDLFLHSAQLKCMGILLALSGIAIAAPTITVTGTDAPGNGALASGNYFAKAYDLTDYYPGVISFTINDDGGAFEAVVGQNSVPGSTDAPIEIRYQTATGTSKGTLPVEWGTHVTGTGNDISGNGTWTLELRYAHPGALAGNVIKLRVLDAVGGSVVATSSANVYLDMQAPTAPIMTLPIGTSAAVNFIGNAEYTMQGTITRANVASYFTGSLGATVYDTYSYAFKAGNSQSLTDDIYITNPTVASGTSVSGSGDFTTSGNQRAYLGIIAFDNAGNETPTASAFGNLLTTTWYTVGKIRESGGTWYGDDNYANAWDTETAALAAGNLIDVVMYSVDYYGKRSYDAGELGRTAGPGVPADTSYTAAAGFNGNVAAFSSPAGNSAYSTDGSVTYTGVGNSLTFYRQQYIKIGASGTTTLDPVDSKPIKIKHNVSNDFVFLDTFDSSYLTTGGNGVSTKVPAASRLLTAGNTAAGNITAGSPLTVKVAALDAHQNIVLDANSSITVGCNVIGGAGNTPNNAWVVDYGPFVPDGTTLPIGNAALYSGLNTGYTPNYYTDTVGGNAWSSASSGVLTFRATLYRNEMVNLQIAQGNAVTANGNTTNDQSVTFGVEAATADSLFFDADSNEDDGYTNFSGVTAGTPFNVYVRVADRYGNHVPSAYSGSTVEITYAVSDSATFGTTIPSNAFNGGGTATVFGNVSTALVANGNADFLASGSNIILQRAAKSNLANVAFGLGNAFLYPYEEVALRAYLVGTPAVAGNSQPFEVDVADSGNVLFFACGNTTSQLQFSTLPSNSFDGGVTTSLIAGNSYYFYGITGDAFGNPYVVTSGMNSITASLSGNSTSAGGYAATLSDSPARIGAGNLTATIRGGNNIVGPFLFIPRTAESSVTIALGNVSMEDNVFVDVTEYTNAFINFTVQSASFSNLAFLTSGNAVTTTPLSNIPAGTAQTVKVSGTDQFSNIISSLSSPGNVYLWPTGANTITTMTSPGGSVASLNTGSGLVALNAASGGNHLRGETAAGNFYWVGNLYLYDANSSISLSAIHTGSAGGIITTNLISVGNAVNTSISTLGFVSGNTLDNDSLNISNTGRWGNTATVTTWANGNAIEAGNSQHIYIAGLDSFGNIYETDLGTLASNTVTLTATTTSPAGNTPSFNGNSESFNGNMILAFLGNVVKAGTTAITTSVGPQSCTSASVTVTASANTFMNKVRFCDDSTGTWNSYTPGVSGTSPLTETESESALSDCYVGFYDEFGNLKTTYVGDAGKYIRIVPGDLDAADGVASEYITLTAGNITSGVVFFDPNNAIKKAVVTHAADSTFTVKPELVGLSAQVYDSNQVSLKTDFVPPTISLTAPNGGESWYATPAAEPSTGNFLISWNKSDNNELTGNGNIKLYLSLDGGLNFSRVITTALANSANSYAYKVPPGIETERARVRIIINDDSGNEASDESNADFTIRDAARVVNYAVSDVGATSIKVFFREPVYSEAGGNALSRASFIYTDSNTTSNANVLGTDLVSTTDHVSGGTSLSLSLSRTMTEYDINLDTLGGNTGGAEQISPNVTGANPYYDSTSCAATSIRQLASQRMGIAYTTASSRQDVLGLKLVGWSGNTRLTSMSVTLSQSGGSIETSDFATAATNSLASGIGVFNAVSGNALVMSSAPTLAIGTPMTLSFASSADNVLGSSALVGTGNVNYYVSVKTSSTIDGTAGDAFKVTVNSVSIYDEGSGLNRLYSLYGNTATGVIVADTTAPATPTITYTSPVNDANDHIFSLDIEGEASSVATYTITGTGNAATVTGNANISASGNVKLYRDLTSMFTGNALDAAGNLLTISVYLKDQAGNSGQGTSEKTSTFYYDVTAPRVLAGSITMGNVTNSNKSAVSLSIDPYNSDTDVSAYEISFYNSTDGAISAGNVVVSGSLSGVASKTISGVDLTSLSDNAICYGNLVLTDSRGNIGPGNTFTFTKDVVAPSITSLALGGNGYINAGNSEIYLVVNTSDATASIYSLAWSMADGTGTTLTGSNIYSGGGASNPYYIDGSALQEGTTTITATLQDNNSNTSSSSQITMPVDKTSPSAPTISYSSPVNLVNISGFDLSVVGEANSTARYVFTASGNGNFVDGTLPLGAGGSGNILVNLSSLANPSVDYEFLSLAVSLKDQYENDSYGTVSKTKTATMRIDVKAPSASTVAAGNINLAASTSAPFVITTASTDAATYSLVVIDSSSRTVSSSGTLTANAATTVYVNVSSLSDGVLNGNLTITDIASNPGNQYFAGIGNLDKTAPSIGSIALGGNGYINGDGFEDIILSVATTGAANTDVQTVNYSLADGNGNIRTGTYNWPGDRVESGLSGVGSSLGDGTTTISLTLTDNHGNKGDAASTVIKVDRVAPSAPVISYTSPVNDANDHMVALSVTGEASSRATYSVTGVGNTAPVVGTLNLNSGGTASSVLNLTGMFGPGNLLDAAGNMLTVSVYLTDAVQNTGNGISSLTKSETFWYDVVAPDSVATTIGNVHTSNESTASMVIDPANDDTDVSAYSITFYNSSDAGVTVGANVVATGSITSTVAKTISGIDLSGLADAVVVYGNVILTDSRGNVGGGNLFTFTKDTDAPVITSVTVLGDGYINAANNTIYLSVVTGSSGVATLDYSMADGHGNVLTGNQGWTAMGTNTLSGTGLGEGTTTITVTLTDQDSNTSIAKTVSLQVDRVAPSTPILISPIGRAGAPAETVFSWSAANDAVIYNIVVLDMNDAVVFASNGLVGTSYTHTPTFTDNLYKWKVQAVDDVNNVGSFSATSQFSVNIPLLLYALGDVNSSLVRAVFNMGVFTTTGSGAVDVSDFLVDSSVGISSVSHTAGEPNAFLTLAKTLLATALGNTDRNVINSLEVGAGVSEIFSASGSPVTSGNVKVRQLVGKDSLAATDYLVYGGSAVNVFGLKLTGWGNDELLWTGANITVVPDMGDLGDSDLASGNAWLVITTAADGQDIGFTGLSSADFIGKPQLITFSENIQLGKTPTSSVNYYIGVKGGATGDGADKAFKIKVSSITLSGNSSSSGTYVISGDSLSTSALLTSLNITTQPTSAKTGVTVYLKANGGDSSANYDWSQVSGSTVSLVKSGNVAQFKPSVAGDYSFKLAYTFGSITVNKTVGVTVTLTQSADAPSIELVSEIDSMSSSGLVVANQEQLDSVISSVDSFVGTNRSVANNDALVRALLNIINVSSSLKMSEGSVQKLVAALDAAVNDESGSATDTASVVSVLQKLYQIVTIIPEAEVTKGFKVLDSMPSSVTSDESTMQATITKMSLMSIKSLTSSGKDELKINRSNVKVSVKSLGNGDDSTSISKGDGSSLASVRITSSLTDLGIAAGKNAFVKMATVNRTAISGQRSSIVDLEIMEVGKEGGDPSVVSVTNLVTPVNVSIQIDLPGSTGSYEVKYWDTLTSTWQSAGIAGVSLASDGKTVNFTTNHLTSFAVFEAPVTGGSAGGGCFLSR